MSKNEKSRAKQSKWLIIIGFLFLVNPCPGGLDLIPDAFGCLMVFFGLTMPAYFDSNIEEARKYTLWMFGVEAVKLIFMRSIFLTEISLNRMLSATAFSILEGIIGILLFKKLFSGISYYAMRHDCEKTLERCDGCSFLSYFALFARIAATLIPELLAIVELSIETETDFDTVDMLTDIVSIKPVLTVLLSMLALGIGVAWFVSLCKLFSALFAESGAEMETKYELEYTSRPEETMPKAISRGSIAMKLALVFVLDIAFDGIRIMPVGAMYFGIIIATLFFRGIGNFKKAQIYAIPAGILFFIAEIFQMNYVPNGAVVIYETEIIIVAANALIAVAASACGLMCVYSLLDSASEMSTRLGGGALPTGLARAMYIASVLLWSIGYIVPYFFSYITFARFVCAAVFMLKCGRLFSIVAEEEAMRASLRPRDGK